jgi:hypothetical protein
VAGISVDLANGTPANPGRQAVGDNEDVDYTNTIHTDGQRQGQGD